MAKPRQWEHGDGCLPDLTPNIDDFESYQEGSINGATYRKRFLFDLEYIELEPGALMAFKANIDPVKAEDGDTLCCSCSRDSAARGLCHRAWIAPLLIDAGWRVILDGEELHRKETRNGKTNLYLPSS